MAPLQYPIYPCKHCGSDKDLHYDIAKWTGMGLNDVTIQIVSQDIQRHFRLFGRLCIRYELDNLRYLEILDLEKETK